MGERRTHDATLIAAVRILARDIESGDGCANACLLEVAARLAELIEERRWVPVGERLPEIDVQVLVWQQGCISPEIGWREHRPYYTVPETIWTLGDELDKGYPPEKITHWMPLPIAPEANA